ncbi:Beta-lactamase [compost metagenome]
MFIDYAPTSDGYGYGWGIDNNIPGIYSHTGYIPGFNSYILRDTEKQQTLIVLSNHDKSNGMFQDSNVIDLIDGIFKDHSSK